VTLNRARTGYDGSFTIDQYARDEVARAHRGPRHCRAVHGRL